MRSIQMFLLGVLASLSFAPMSAANDGGAARAHCLVGTWSGERVVINRLGKQVVWAELVLETVDEGTIRGTSSWGLLTGEGGDALDVPVIQDTEEVYGAIGRRGREFYLAESPETGVLHGRLIGRNRMEVFLIQSGEWPVAGVSVLKREGTPTPGCRLRAKRL
jgi:hypothetical protein